VKLYLFDIDGTLLRSGGAGRLAMERAFLRVHGIAGAFAAVDFRGALDGLVLERVYAQQGLALDRHAEELFKAVFAEELVACLAPGRLPGQRLCPGVPAVLDRLEPLAALGLVTGNWRRGAEGKLRAFSLWSRFPFGAFSEDGSSRAQLIRRAVERARGQGLAPSRVVMVGDTPHDVAAARQAGAVAVAVQTGWSEPESLRGAGPDLLLPDLEQGLEALVGV